MTPNDVDGHELWESAWLTIGDYRMRGSSVFSVHAIFDESARPKLVRLTVKDVTPLAETEETSLTENQP